MKSQNQSYEPSLDHLRAFAALLIVLYHSFQLLSSNIAFGRNFVEQDWIRTKNPLIAFIAEGHTAVGLFIVLSGFLFTRSCLHRGIDYRSFIKNRIFRIYPMYLVLLALACAMFPKSVDLNSLVLTVLPIGMSSATPVFQPIASMFWAVGVEFQFYLIFPFLIRILNRDGVAPIVGMIVMAIILRLIASLLGANPREVSYWMAVGRIDQFLIGMLTAKVLIDHPGLGKRLGRFFIPACAVLLGTIFAFHRAGGWPSTSLWKVFWPTIESVVWAFVLASYLQVAKQLPTFISKCLSRVGEISYSTYLLHFMVIMVICQHHLYFSFSANQYYSALLNACVFVIPAVLAVSMISYLAIEQPFLRFRTRYTFALPDNEQLSAP